MGQQRRQFSPGSKADALALARSPGTSLSPIAREPRIRESNLRCWLKRTKPIAGRAIPAGSRPSPPNLVRLWPSP
jgi:transposase-like protein